MIENSLTPHGLLGGCHLRFYTSRKLCNLKCWQHHGHLSPQLTYYILVCIGSTLIRQDKPGRWHEIDIEKKYSLSLCEADGTIPDCIDGVEPRLDLA